MSRNYIDLCGTMAITGGCSYPMQYEASPPVHDTQFSFRCAHCAGVNRWRVDAEPAHKCRYCGAPPT